MKLVKTSEVIIKNNILLQLKANAGNFSSILVMKDICIKKKTPEIMDKRFNKKHILWSSNTLVAKQPIAFYHIESISFCPHAAWKMDTYQGRGPLMEH